MLSETTSWKSNTHHIGPSSVQIFYMVHSNDYLITASFSEKLNLRHMQKDHVQFWFYDLAKKNLAIGKSMLFLTLIWKCLSLTEENYVPNRNIVTLRFKSKNKLRYWLGKFYFSFGSHCYRLLFLIHRLHFLFYVILVNDKTFSICFYQNLFFIAPAIQYFNMTNIKYTSIKTLNQEHGSGVPEVTCSTEHQAPEWSCLIYFQYTSLQTFPHILQRTRTD